MRFYVCVCACLSPQVSVRLKVCVSMSEVCQSMCLCLHVSVNVCLLFVSETEEEKEAKRNVEGERKDEPQEALLNMFASEPKMCQKNCSFVGRPWVTYADHLATSNCRSCQAPAFLEKTIGCLQSLEVLLCH